MEHLGEGAPGAEGAAVEVDDEREPPARRDRADAEEEARRHAGGGVDDDVPGCHAGRPRVLGGRHESVAHESLDAAAFVGVRRNGRMSSTISDSAFLAAGALLMITIVCMAMG